MVEGIERSFTLFPEICFQKDVCGCPNLTDPDLYRLVQLFSTFGSTQVWDINQDPHSTRFQYRGARIVGIYKIDNALVLEKYLAEKKDASFEEVCGC
jgi:hypothetical protein